jgi:hypothetical protein
MYLGTKGNSNMMEIVSKVEEIGFVSFLGPADFIYDWKEKKPTKEDIFKLCDKLMEKLNGSDVTFNLETHD